MRIKRAARISAALKVAGAVMVLCLGPGVTPFLVWIALAANLPLVTVILLLISMTVISNCLANVTLHMCSSHGPGPIGSNRITIGTHREPEG